MGEIGIHLENIVVAALQGPFESGEIGGAEPELAAALDKVEPGGELLLQALHHGSGAVGGAVVDDQYLESVLQPEDGADNLFRIFDLVVGRNYHQILHIQQI